MPMWSFLRFQNIKFVDSLSSDLTVIVLTMLLPCTFPRLIPVRTTGGGLLQPAFVKRQAPAAGYQQQGPTDKRGWNHKFLWESGFLQVHNICTKTQATWCKGMFLCQHSYETTQRCKIIAFECICSSHGKLFMVWVHWCRPKELSCRLVD